MLPPQARVNLEVVAMKGYSVFPKISRTLSREYYPCAEMLSVYSATPEIVENPFMLLPANSGCISASRFRTYFEVVVHHFYP